MHREIKKNLTTANVIRLVAHVSSGPIIGKVTAIHFGWVRITETAIGPTVVALVADRIFLGTAGALGSALSSIGGALAITGRVCVFAVYWQLRPKKALAKLVTRDVTQR
ncbi:hypothetical protein JQ615_05905 [Bradyrhizobium jicamae]|uniref:Polysaccharide biosynthesis protein C-terminal domain-containing protein n=1 Tax=Bradyrhizobium jicamae TaxID=280332 RepID=A0ABS5FDQ8_9BRAD|nr:hypothetical protein [Bradyrhizobium jicamae]MBR0794921.1 hypothetical protein [Bradyrhizobium jicamae]